MNVNQIISDPLYGFIQIDSDILLKTINDPIMQRLRRISQIGLSSYVFPSATHDRFSHSLGAMELISRSLDTLQRKGYNLSEDEKISSKLAILLHDVGHAPFSHTLEHIFLKDIAHEDISLYAIEYLAKKFASKELEKAALIFSGEYHKKPLHQLISSQLDMDRLDYLSRDSFYTGVSDAGVNTQRIIATISASQDNIVFEEKGIYSLENFIIARRLMYWQVYLHKTVLSADTLLRKILLRAKYLLENGEKIFIADNLKSMLLNPIEGSCLNDKTFQTYLSLDQSDIYFHIKTWSEGKDNILKNLSEYFLNRKLFSAFLLEEPLSKDKEEEILKLISQHFSIDIEEAKYFFSSEEIKNNVYKPKEDKILVRLKNGQILPITQVSKQINFSKNRIETKFFVAYPKKLKEKLKTICGI